jgi:RNA polymerase sigma-32 factor
LSRRNTLDQLDTPRSGSSFSPSHRDVLLDRYLDEVGRHPMLDAETERHLIERYTLAGDQDAGNRLITANLRLVVKMATQYRWRWVRLLDLIQEGNVGLTIALSRFDPTRGVPFGRYAAYWIRAMILRYLSANYRMVDLGSGQHARKLFFRLNQERARLLSDGIDPTPRALAESFGIPESAVRDIDRFMRAPAVSLHTARDDDGSPLELLLGDSRGTDPEHLAAEQEWRGLVRGELEHFGEGLEDERERLIWQERLRSSSPMSLSDLGREFGISKQRVAQVESRLKRRLREHISEGIGSEIDSILCDPPGWSHVRCTSPLEKL